MSNWLIAIVTLIYLGVAFDLAMRRDWMGLTFLGYALANVGIILALRK